MKKKSVKKMLTSSAAILTIAALAVPGVSVFAVDTPTINTLPANKLTTAAATADVTVNKDIVLFNVDGSSILSPNITYSYDITPANVNTAKITTYAPEDLDTDGKTPKTGAVPVTVTVKPGTLAAVTTTNDDTSTTNKVEGNITFGAADDTNHNDNTNKHAANAESVTRVDLTKKVSSTMTITVNANKIYDPEYGNVGHTNAQVNGPGVYRYRIEDVTAAATLTASGIERRYENHANNHDKYIYLDVYTKYNSEKNGLLVYGYVLLKDVEGNDNVSVNYNKDTASETLKITGFDTESENNEIYGDGTVAKAALTSDAYHTYNVEVSKKTAGDLADTQHNFPFKVELSNTNTVTSLDDFYYVITKDGTPQAEVITNLSNDGAWTLDGATQSTNLQLQNGDKILITGLPVNTKIKVTETNDTADTYTVSAKDTDNTALSVNNSTTSVSVNAGTTAAMDNAFAVDNTTALDKIEFTNTLKDISVTGLMFSIAPFVFITIAGVALLVLVMKNRKNSDNKSKI